MDMERVIQEAYDNGYLRGYEKGKAERVQGDDLIRRSDVIKAFDECLETSECGTMLSDEKYLDRLKAIPSADRPTWIPCSERLPSKQGQYLVTTYACDDYYYVDVLSFHKGEFYSTDSEWGDMVDNDVTAWMPLPKPYGEREGE